jgi:tetratricopeptide (TPR) repeat protein
MDASFSFPDLKLVTEDIPEEPKLTPVEQASKLINEGKEFLKRYNEEKMKFEDEVLAKKESQIQLKKNQEVEESNQTDEEIQQLLKKERHEDREAARKKKEISSILKDACYSFSEASELLLTTFGAESPKIAESFLLYGSTLLTTVQESTSTNIFSDPVADTINEKAQVIDKSFNELQSDLEKGEEGEEGDEEDESDFDSESGEYDEQGDSDYDEGSDDGMDAEGGLEGMEVKEDVVPEGEGGNGEESDGSSELTSDSEEQADEVDSLELAWDILERARFALQKTEDPDFKFLLSEVHERLADVALESDNIEGAFEEFQKCIVIRAELGEKRSLAEVYFLAGIAIQNEKKVESLDFLQKAQTILEELLMKSPENKKEELISIIIDVKKRVAEVKDLIENSNKIETNQSLKTSDGVVRDFGVVGGTRKQPKQEESNPSTTTTTSTNSTTENNNTTRAKKRKALEEKDEENVIEKKKKTD